MAIPFLRVIAQKHDRDCGVACLAMLLGLEYEKVLAAFKHNVVCHGTNIRQLVHAGKRLGYSLVWTRKVDVEHDTGLLMVKSSQWKSEHMVVLKEDMIIDTDLTLWEASVFLGTYDARVLSIVKVEEE